MNGQEITDGVFCATIFAVKADRLNTSLVQAGATLGHLSISINRRISGLLPRKRGAMQDRTETPQLTEQQAALAFSFKRYLLEIAIVLATYSIAGKLGQATTTIRSGNLGPVWPAYGVALAAVILCGTRIWPAVGAGAFLIAFLSPVGAVTALGQATGATLAALTGALLLNRVVAFDPSMQRLKDAVWLIVIGAFGSALVSSSIGTWVLYKAHITPYAGLASAWLVYWMGDSAGVLLVTPLIVTLRSLPLLRDWRLLVELGSLILLLTVSSFIIFAGNLFLSVNLNFLAFGVLPFVMWAAIRFGTRATSLSVLIIASVATVETAFGSGPFAGNSSFTNAVLLDVFFTVISLTGLTLAGASTERGEAERTRERLAREEALSTVSKKLIDAQEEERSRIARELHDDINQRLALLAVKLDVLRQSPQASIADVRPAIAEASKEVQDLGNDIQVLSHSLHSSKLDYLGLTSAASGFCRELSQRPGVEIDFHSENVPKDLPKEISLCLFRTLQEGLQNAIKHSGSRQFQVSLRVGPSEIELIVRDSGMGFDPEEAMQGQGLGLLSMKERLKLVNGTLSIDSQPQVGTTIHARVPLSLRTKSAGAAE